MTGHPNYPSVWDDMLMHYSQPRPQRRERELWYSLNETAACGQRLTITRVLTSTFNPTPLPQLKSLKRWLHE